MAHKILMVDDDQNICKATNMYLQKERYIVDFAQDGEEALALFHKTNYDLILLDLMLPKLDGWAVCRKIRKRSTVPIIMLTARGQGHEKVEGFQLGADDYIVKPFDPNELLARIKAVLRRTSQDTKISSAPPSDVITLGNVEISPTSFTVKQNGQTLKVTKKEFELLLFLAQHPNRAFERSELIEKIWGWDFEGEDRVIDLYIKRLREKINGEDSWQIKTVWGVGYQLEVRK
ncbi:response regulator transcription factor [Ammoniphilus sp. CFH 90114]|uniref:response regulator transcription factor n=1 Tax=Ammoniphilus sp. CFH 90114 TaxID=2493665 RepID=UPI00100EC553|nr:response regulator transcription factor [Ammoniphilus sp. CFH 90114]RXT02367.1 response regulator transcription factor [Ammoniphilus sp. CFH 90114]